MCRTGVPSRQRFNFADTARDVFAPLTRYGLTERDATPTLLCFRNDTVFVNVYHGRSSYELGIEVGLCGHQKSHSMSALIRAADPERADGYRNPIVTEPAQLRSGLQRLFADLAEYGEKALMGDIDFFSRLSAQEQQWANEYSEQVLYSQLAPRAAEAFREGNYAYATELYERIESRLTPAERAKLEYARRKK